jgi:hypothetical protein
VSELKLVVDSPEETLGGKKCRLKTNRYQNGKVVIEIADFQVDIETAQTISDGLNNFKSFQEQLLEIEKQLNAPKEEGK